MPYTIPYTFITETGDQPSSQLDTNFTTLLTGLNRVYQTGLLSARPAFGTAGQFYFATDVNGGTLYLDTGAAWIQIAAAVGSSILRSYLAGLGLSNDGTSPQTVLDIAAGQAVNSTNAAYLSLTSAWTKSTASWVQGTANGGLDTGTIAATTWYHVFVIGQAGGAGADVLFSLSPSAPTLPTGYTLFRRIGSFLTDGSAHILAFTQDGDYFRWSASVLDVDTTNPGTSAVTALLTVPTGVNVQALLDVQRTDSAASGYVYVSDLSATDEAPSSTAAPLGSMGNAVAGSQAVGNLIVRTNTSAQVRYRCQSADSNTVIRIATLGWWDRRGRDA